MEKQKDTFSTYGEFISYSEWIIHLDAGHGGLIDGKYQTKGKQYKHGTKTFYEGVFNRSIAIRIATSLLQKNISHSFTTDSNVDVSLRLRVARINNLIRKFPDKKHLVLSLHGNAFGVESVKGIEVFTSPGKDESDKYATVMYQELKGMGWSMRDDFSDGDPDKEARFYMVTQPKCPSVLIEYGFYSNPKEAALMNKSSVQDKLANLTVSGILRIIG